jgi:hypothetical protein
MTKFVYRTLRPLRNLNREGSIATLPIKDWCMMAIYELSASDTLISDPAPAIHIKSLLIYELVTIGDIANNYRLSIGDALIIDEEVILSNDKTLAVTDSLQVGDVPRRVKICDATDSVAPSETSGRAEIESDDVVTNTESAINVKNQPSKDTISVGELITLQSFKKLSTIDSIITSEGATHYNLNFTKVYHPT